MPRSSIIKEGGLYSKYTAVLFGSLCVKKLSAQDDLVPIEENFLN